MPKKIIKKEPKIKENKEVVSKTGQQVMRGRVVSAKNPKTVTVLVAGVKTHPLYRKTYKSSKRYLVHDELGVSEGDLVEVVKIKPVSKNKHFQILKVVGKDIEAMVEEQLKEEAAKEIAEVMPEKPEESEDQNTEKSENTEKEPETQKKKKEGKK